MILIFNKRGGLFYMEVWKNIKGYEGLYQVSSLSRVRNKDRKVLSSSGVLRFYKSRIIKVYTHKNKSVIVTLIKDSKCKRHYLHRVIATAFLPNSHNKPCINHIDGDRSNNELDNIEWCTYKENSEHSYNNNLSSRNDNIILTNISNGEIKTFRSQRKVCEFLGESCNYINRKLQKGINGNKEWKWEVI
jgi:hypothetical protein